jgi:DNA-binding NarL/FixJ family response regulator
VRIALVNSDRLLCDGLSRILRGDPSFQVSVCGDQAARDTGFDVCLLDARTGSVRAAEPNRGDRPYLIVVNAPDGDEWAVDALGRGVRGVLSRDSSAEDLLKAIHVVHDGGIWARRRWLDACVHRAVASRQRIAIKPAPRLDERLSNRRRQQGAGDAALHQRGHGQSASHPHFPEARCERARRTGGGLSRATSRPDVAGRTTIGVSPGPLPPRKISRSAN